MRLTGWLLVGLVYALLGVGFGFVRAAVGLGLALLILWLGLSYFRAAGEVPPDAQPDSDPGDLKYVCKVCGLELRVEVATTDRAPSHCREPMVPVTRSGLRPL
ncbi:MAG: hypothetical protein QOG54_1561 [Actinomycetota bacterium]|nr:hypothetical protein [Actinomycetota bacterium]